MAAVCCTAPVSGSAEPIPSGMFCTGLPSGVWGSCMGKLLGCCICCATGCCANVLDRGYAGCSVSGRTAAPRPPARSISCTRLGFRLTVTTVPLPMLSSMDTAPPAFSRYSCTMGNPAPVPRMYRFMLLFALVTPKSNARSLSSIPGPWSANRMVSPPSRIEMMGSAKWAWIKFSTISRITMSEMCPPCSFMHW